MVHAHRLDELIINIVKIPILLIATCRFSVIPLTFQMAFFKEIEQIMLKFVCSHQKNPQIA